MVKTVKNKEQAILDAAEREFLMHGYDGARTTSIAEYAGVTHAMLHYYFGTKENIFERIMDEKIRVMGESVLAAFGKSDQPLTERLCEGIASHFDFIMDNPDLPRFIVNEVISRPERYEVMTERIKKIAGILIADLQKEFDEAARRGEVDQIDVRMLILDIISLNVFTFIAYPIVETILGDWADDKNKFLLRRKRENIEIIMRRIKKY